MTNDLFPVQEEPDYFELFWHAGMYKTGKKQARKVFEKIISKEPNPSEFTQKLVDDIEKRLRLNQFGFDGLHPATYLNNERWDDDYPKPLKEQKTVQRQDNKQSFQSLHDNVRF